MSIVIAIDFGTTHSGVAWALNEGENKVRLITDWPNSATATNANAEKMPSIISYSNGRVHDWGYEVDLKEDALRWFKLLLEPRAPESKVTTEVRESSELLKKVNKTAEEVVSDYLRQLWVYTKEQIRKYVGDDDWESNFAVNLVLTVPAMWSHAAKDNTVRAAKAAGLPENMQLVTEPEAAALATLHDKEEENTLKKGDTFVVCDAGGGTVDLISYKVNSTNPLQIEECATGEVGGLCGSVYLDRQFEKHIQTLVGESQYRDIKQRHRKEMLKKFEHGIKRCFLANSTRDYTVDLRGVKDNEAEGIIDETISLKSSMLRTVFDMVCGQIETLVDNQVAQVASRGKGVTAILLVGGFGSSKYLHHRLETSNQSKAIKVLQIDGAWSVICRGACLWGLQHAAKSPRYSLVPEQAAPSPPPTVVSCIAKCSYGIYVLVPFDPLQHKLEDRVLDMSKGTYLAQNQMTWLLRRGEKVKNGHVLQIKVVGSVHGVKFYSTSDRDFAQKLYCSTDKIPPSQLCNNVKELCNVSFAVPASTIWAAEDSYTSKYKPGKWRDMTFDLTVELGSATLKYRVTYHGEVVGHVEATYADSV